MTALAADTIRNMSVNEEIFHNYVIANAAQIYVGSWCDIVSGYAQTHTTGHTIQGLAVGPGVPGNDPNMDGFANPPVSAIAPGNNTAPKNQVVLNEGEITLLLVTTITSAAGAQSDVGTPVYLSDDNLITTVQPGGDKPLGEISFWTSVGSTNYWNVKCYRFSARTITT
jgi:hypothetical protein